jgi:SAM-dependent methyltransferase
MSSELSKILVEACNANAVVRGVFSLARNMVSDVVRITVRPVTIRGKCFYQFTSQTQTQQFHKNLEVAESADEMLRLLTTEFRNLNLRTLTAEYSVQHARSGKCFVKRLKRLSGVNTNPIESENAEHASPRLELVNHNRSRNHLIPDGIPCPFLVHTGIMSPSGMVRSSYTKKFRQINRYLEFIRDVVDRLPTDRAIRIVDFGCGKSYLTFAAHYLLSQLLNREVEILGLDLRRDVVDMCSNIAKALSLSKVHFEVGDIASFDLAKSEDLGFEHVDLVISLHACDTATDEAILRAIEWNSQVILAVPCCQQELNKQLSTSSLLPLTQYGIARERLATLATDTMRASLLNAVGYRTQVIEFIETEHTPKNLLLRSVRSTDKTNLFDSASYEQVLSLRKLLRIDPLTLERRLLDKGKLP